MWCLEHFTLEHFISAVGRKVKFLTFQFHFFLHWCIWRYYLVIVHIYWIWLILDLNLWYSLCFFNQCLWHSLDLLNLNLFTALLFLLFFCWLFFFILFHIWLSPSNDLLLWVLYFGRHFILFFPTIVSLSSLLLRLTDSAWLLFFGLFLILFFLFTHVDHNLSYAAVLNV